MCAIAEFTRLGQCWLINCYVFCLALSSFLFAGMAIATPLLTLRLVDEIADSRSFRCCNARWLPRQDYRQTVSRSDCYLWAGT